MLIFSVVIFVFSTLTLSPRPPLPRKVGVMTPQLLWERRPCFHGAVQFNYDSMYIHVDLCLLPIYVSLYNHVQHCT